MSPLAVNVWGDLRSRSPKAQDARRTTLALLAAGIEVTVVETELERLMPDAQMSPEIDALRRVGAADRTAVLDLHLDDLDGFARKPRALVHPTGRTSYAIGAWSYDRQWLAWDTVFPLEAVDEVWVGSTYTQDVLRGTSKPVHVVPPVSTVTEAAPDRARFGLWPASTVFGHVFDARDSYEIAGLPALFEAYARAFAPHERGTCTMLAVAVHGLAARPSLAAELAELATSVRARLVDLQDDEDAFVASCDAYLSLHRREATGRQIAGAMAAGVPVIATAWGAHLDWADAICSRHVGYTVTAVEARHHRFDQRLRRRYPVGEPWAEPDLDQAAFWMRDLHEQPSERARLGALGHQVLEQHLSPTAVGAVIRARLEALADRLAVLPPGP